MFRYRLHSPDGDDLGEATYAVMIKPGSLAGRTCSRQVSQMQPGAWSSHRAAPDYRQASDVEDDRHWPVVHEFELHVGAEGAGLNRDAERP